MKYKIYRIYVVNNKSWRTEVYTNNLKCFREEIANTFRTSPSNILFCYETDEPYIDHPIKNL